jgi:hypothetical protein
MWYQTLTNKGYKPVNITSLQLCLTCQYGISHNVELSNNINSQLLTMLYINKGDNIHKCPLIK